MQGDAFKGELCTWRVKIITHQSATLLLKSIPKCRDHNKYLKNDFF